MGLERRVVGCLAVVACAALPGCFLGSCGAFFGLDPGASFDAGLDLGTGRDAGARDADADAGRADAGDAGADFDAGCITGSACATSADCPRGVCEVEEHGTGSYGLPDGGTVTWSVTANRGGYCTATPYATAWACDPARASNDPAHAGEDGCEPCAKCVVRETGTRDAPGPVHCERRCVPVDGAPGCLPTAICAPACRPGYACDPGSRTCETLGCTNDDECRLAQTDTNGDGTLDGSDRVAVDPGADATCDVASGTCHEPGNAAAEAGDACTSGAGCEPDGVCAASLDLGRAWPGRYCTKRGCREPGRACAGAGRCTWLVSRAEWWCMRGCTPGAEDASLVLGPGGHGDTCRPGYACVFDPVSAVAGTTGSGACVLGVYDDVTTPNVGEACTADADCWSPHGLGFCVRGGTSGHCEVRGCAGLTEPAPCGPAADCSTFDDAAGRCLVPCSTPADCAAAGQPATFACVALSPSSPVKHCALHCSYDWECLPGRHCTARVPLEGYCS